MGHKQVEWNHSSSHSGTPYSLWDPMSRESTNFPQDRWTWGAQIILARHHSRQTKAKMCWKSCHPTRSHSRGAGRGLAILALAILYSSAHWPSLTPYSLEFPFLPVHYLCLSSSFISLHQLCCNHSIIKRIPHQILKISKFGIFPHTLIHCLQFLCMDFFVLLPDQG